ncbi:MAG TPA: DPP IV N-terminal domain-containing protein [Rhodanobacteraceae bacterium]|nr:DPP IV N-terminal domain-containing protein [Rhodanobacteraceae bacterium]
MRVLHSGLVLLAIFAMAGIPSAHAEQLTIERIYSDPALAGPAPRNVQVAPDGSRVTFLRGKADNQDQLDLWEYNLADHATRLLVDSKALEPDGEHLSDAEKSRRERARTAGLHGIVDYQWAPDSSKLLIPLNGDLYLYDFAGKHIRRLTENAGALDPKISPKGHYVSYVHEQNLWVIDLADGKAVQLTHDGKGSIHNGEAEFVAQEEMDRRTGYWWAPDDSLIAFERYDDARVPVTKRFEVYPDRTEVISQHYPAAGDPNVHVKLGLIAPTGGEPRWIDLGRNPDIYLVRVDWLPDAQKLAYQRMQRSQQKLDLQLVDVATLQQRMLLSETSKTWINLNDDLHFLKGQPAFVWGSERSGWHHLYLYGLDGKLEHPISAGDWNLDGVLALDEKAGLVYVSSNKDSVPDKQIYALKLDGSDAQHPLRISAHDGWHEARFSGNASMYVDTFSDPATPPQVSVHKAGGEFVAWIEQNRLDAKHPYWPYHDAHVLPVFGTLKADDGQTLYYKMYKPLHFNAAKKYPVMLHFYGGPTAQMVTRSWPDLFDEFMAQHGFVVFTLDNRGMARRGRAFSDPIYHQLGDVEVADQRAGIAWLRTQPWVDAAHIGTFGWSYGGYLSTMMLAKDSGELAGGVSVAPVTDWRLYDTYYTERYLGLPRDNEAGYTRSAVFAWLDGLASPLLLIHGMADDNVLFLNSTRLMAALQARGTQFQLMTYPGGKHGLSTPAMRKHAFTAIADFFEQTVAGKCPGPGAPATAGTAARPEP